MQGSRLVRLTWGLIVVLPAILAGCKDDFKTTAEASPVAGNPGKPANASIVISGNPAASVGVGAQYVFTPSVTADPSSRITFSIQNKPAWASFNVVTGRLGGVPNAGDAGAYVGILIAASDGTSGSSLPQFEITVNPVQTSESAATLSWAAPTNNADGTPLTDLAGYRIYFGNAPDSLTQQVTIDGAETTEYVVKNLSAGVWYFALKAYNSMNLESDLSPIVHKTI